MTAGIEEKLTELGIEYIKQFKQHDVPCQRTVEFIISPKTELEFWAARGVLRM